MEALSLSCVAGGEVIVPALTWVSDVASVVQSRFVPVFVDIDPRTLGMDTKKVLEALTPSTAAVFITHVLGHNALTRRLLDELKARGIPLIEDVCEAHGATFQGKKLGTFGHISNFSFYYAHHMSTVEGGMVCTDNPDLYAVLRMLRSHGMVRESGSEELAEIYREDYPDVPPDFTFAMPAYNVRNTEINAVIGRSGLKRLDENNQKRTENLAVFLNNLDPKKYRTNFDTKGSCSYGFPLVYTGSRLEMVEETLRRVGVEYRRGLIGGGNQLRQPYLRGFDDFKDFPEVEKIHFNGFYIGNYPDLEHSKIQQLCAILNEL
jgi:CDP-6-deoxy-D-xylo-4-hexulose-3-dehydrase